MREASSDNGPRTWPVDVSLHISDTLLIHDDLHAVDGRLCELPARIEEREPLACATAKARVARGTKPDSHLISSMMAFIALGLMFSFVLAACIAAPGRYACAHTAPASVHASPHPECVEARAWLARTWRQRESSCTSRCGAVARRTPGPWPHGRTRP